MSLALNARQERFCRELVQGGDATAAAIRADYARWHAGMYGQVLLAMPRVRARIAELRGEPVSHKDPDARSLAALTELARAWRRAPAPPADIRGLATLDDLEQLRRSMMAARTRTPATPAPPRHHAAAPGADRNGDNGRQVEATCAKDHIKDFINRNAADIAAAGSRRQQASGAPARQSGAG